MSDLKKARAKEERRGAIIQAAIRLFARQGFERTTTREIAAEAGIAEGTIYTYFASKQDILFAFLEPVAFTPVPVLFEAHAQESDEEMLHAFLRDRFTVWEANRDLMRVVIGEALFNPTLAAGLHRLMGPAIQSVEAYIARRIHEGGFRPVDPTIAARALLGHLLAYFLHWRLLSASFEPLTAQRLIDELTTLFLRGIQACPGEGAEQ